MSNFIQVTPFMHVADLDRAITFFTETLGFETYFFASPTTPMWNARRWASVYWSRLVRMEPLPAIGASPITSMFMMWIVCTLNSDRSSMLCLRVMSTGPWTRATVSGNCWYSRRMET